MHFSFPHVHNTWAGIIRCRGVFIVVVAHDKIFPPNHSQLGIYSDTLDKGIAAPCSYLNMYFIGVQRNRLFIPAVIPYIHFILLELPIQHHLRVGAIISVFPQLHGPLQCRHPIELSRICLIRKLHGNLSRQARTAAHKGTLDGFAT
jgi:hypothetical protein